MMHPEVASQWMNKSSYGIKFRITILNFSTKRKVNHSTIKKLNNLSLFCADLCHRVYQNPYF